ncbi:MAG: type I-C CRISPR-associated protein Cas5 [Planctomycetes bacterium]|nr:type I-C CRISPR-associated protein Cas5 [Planctomycetota bacterium]NOG53195.1 type I-C CRISPR-associated protein Cas5 [Planctomycetota bacterium]
MAFGSCLKVWGDWACFTRPEMKAERVSYDVMTPSAARGILEAIYWKPQIRWVVDRIHVLRPIKFMNLRRNEVGSRIPAGTVASAMRSGEGRLRLVIEEDRQQRAAMILRDVAYLIDARIDLLDETEPIGKHLDQFTRRARRGQCFHRPYLGCREFDAQFALVEDDPPQSNLAGTPEGNRDLGFMLHDIHFDEGMTPRFFRAVMRDGVIDVPDFHSEEVRS